MHPIVEAIFNGENPKSILEVGCQNGVLLDQYANGKDIKVYGMDIADFKKGFESQTQGKFIHQDACEKWPMKDKSIDLVFTIGTMLLIKDPLPVLKEMLRVGKKVVLAEFHDENERVEEAGMYETRIFRDYNKLFSKFGITPTIEKVEDKWVIKT